MKLFKNRTIHHKFLISLLLIIIINSISLIFWYNFRIVPENKAINNMKANIINELQPTYQNKQTLITDLNKISKKYHLKFEIITNNRKIKSDKLSEKDIFLFACTSKINNETYIINIYRYQNFGIASATIKLIIFQCIIISILMIIMYLLNGQEIIKPIEKLENDIKNYKFGKKPTKNKVKTEIDIIQNEFVNLTNSLEQEKTKQNQLIASISHDIKTPLTSILGYATLNAEDKITKKEMQKYNQKIKEKALHIKNLLNAFDDYLINYDNQKLTLHTIKIKDLINSLNDDYKIELKNKGITFIINTNINEQTITLDILKIKRIFSNIIANSIRYVPKNGKITITIEEENNFIKFRVSDNGKGAKQEVIDKMFDPFYTTDQSRKISGLGLSICKEFVQMHKGTIKAYNEQGLTIEFTIAKHLNNS